MFAALSWLPRGQSRAKLPQNAAPGSAPALRPPVRDADDSSDSDGSVDVGEVLAADLNTLAVFSSNRDDPYLAADDDACAAFDAEEMHDLTMRPTDALVIAAKSGEDASHLEVHLLEDDPAESEDDSQYRPHFFMHHDVVLPTLPLCTAVTSLARPAGEGSGNESDRLNLVAVGCFTPGIEIWDIDLVNVLEPFAVLGGYQDEMDDAAIAAATSAAEKVAGGSSSASGKSGKAKKKKKSKSKKRPKLRESSHSDAVMALAWNCVQPEYLASGSADTTVKIWDVESAHCARTLSHHSGKVQSVAWHPTEEASLLTGAFDASVQLCDVRSQESPSHTQWSVAADVESVMWGSGPLEGHVLAATEDGLVSVFDRRRGGKAVSSWRAHEGAVSAMALSKDIPGLLVTGSVDKSIKVWDARPCAKDPSVVPELVDERASKAGAVFTAGLCPLVASGPSASPFQLAYAGAKGVLVVTDLAVASEKVRTQFASSTSADASAVILKRAARNKAISTAKEAGAAIRRASKKSAMRDEDDDSDSSDESSDGESNYSLDEEEGDTLAEQ